MRSVDHSVTVRCTHTDTAKSATVGIGGDYGAAKALIADGGWDNGVGDERFLQPFATFGFFHQSEAVLERRLVGNGLCVEWGMKFVSKVGVDQGGAQLLPTIHRTK